jgi:hypothetical protein
MVMPENKKKERTSRGSLWHELLIRRSVALVALLVLFLSSASWLWDELFPTSARPRLVEVLRWFHWYVLVIFGLLLLIVFIGEHAYRLIFSAEREAEETRGKIYTGRPVFALEILGRPSWNNPEPAGEWIFRLSNCGERTARYVQMEPHKSQGGRHTLKFQQVPVLAPRSHVPVGYWVDDSPLLDQTMLRKFLHDSELYSDPLERPVFKWFDIHISFRDMDESVGDEIVRVCFDVDSETLVVHAVPYTQRPPVKVKPLFAE